MQVLDNLSIFSKETMQMLDDQAITSYKLMQTLDPQHPIVSMVGTAWLVQFRSRTNVEEIEHLGILVPAGTRLPHADWGMHHNWDVALPWVDFVVEIVQTMYFPVRELQFILMCTILELIDRCQEKMPGGYIKLDAAE